MVKITDTSDYSRFVAPDGEDEGIWLDHLEVHLVTHPAGQVKEVHVHNPPQDHVVVMRSGQMRWTVEEKSVDCGPGDVIVTAAGTPHSYVVLGDEDATVICIEAPKNPKPES
jgi:quercetin dioxygenase-like cupin family protein